MLPAIPLLIAGAALLKLAPSLTAPSPAPSFRPHKITFAMRVNLDDPREKRMHEADLTDLLQALTRHNLRFLTLFPQTPPLYASGVRYEEEPVGEEDWCDIPTVLQQRWGDCEDLACWRAAELQKQGVPAEAVFRSRRLNDKVTLFHILVRLPNAAPFHGPPRVYRGPGQYIVHFPSGIVIEDPSRVLGMGRKRSQYASLAA